MPEARGSDDLDSDVRLFRAVKFNQFKRDPAGKLRASSAAFQNLEGLKMSVYREDVMLVELETEDEALAALSQLFDEVNYGVIELTVQEYLDEEQLVEPDPRPVELEGPAGPAHTHVIGAKGGTRRKRWAKTARVVRQPTREP